MKSDIFSDLELLGMVSRETRQLFSTRTRDNKNLPVYRDLKSGIIYIESFFTGNETYKSGAYRSNLSAPQASEAESRKSAIRRFRQVKSYIEDKRIVEFGCGSGDFLRLAQSVAADVTGIELQTAFIDSLQSENIACFASIDSLSSEAYEAVLLFHVLEHLPSPINTLKALQQLLKPGGSILIEVPHANDFLLSDELCPEFKDFTLWSQHLVLYTKEALVKLLSHVGFDDVQVTGFQRYGLSNHLNWLAKGLPGGHKSDLAKIESEPLKREYERSLARLGLTDTLMAIASKR